MPVLADVYGLYYNKKELADAGFTAPPKTLDELETMALKLTTYNADGSIKQLGFDPLMGFYENSAAHWGPSTGAQWLKPNGKSAIGGDPGWTEIMTLAEGLRRQDRLRQAAGLHRRTRPGVLGRQRVPDRPGRHEPRRRVPHRVHRRPDPDLDYGTAPFPTASDHSDLHGGGYITGNIGGIAKGSKNPELAWALLKYLTTNTDAVVKLANGLKNAPTTSGASRRRI